MGQITVRKESLDWELKARKAGRRYCSVQKQNFPITQSRGYSKGE
jgi:hypothetical protein